MPTQSLQKILLRRRDELFREVGKFFAFLVVDVRSAGGRRRVTRRAGAVRQQLVERCKVRRVVARLVEPRTVRIRARLGFAGVETDCSGSNKQCMYVCVCACVFWK